MMDTLFLDRCREKRQSDERDLQVQGDLVGASVGLGVRWLQDGRN